VTCLRGGVATAAVLVLTVTGCTRGVSGESVSGSPREL
jgi:hypothetical protein